MIPILSGGVVVTSRTPTVEQPQEPEPLAPSSPVKRAPHVNHGKYGRARAGERQRAPRQIREA